MRPEKLFDIINVKTADPSTLWDGRYKIPWDDPAFSQRMLKEHLSQDHDLASRRSDIIKAQVEWIHHNIASSPPYKLLDSGCGPGFYIKEFTDLGYECTGIDFSPASINYAREQIGDKAQLIHGDIRTADLGTGYNIAVMIYGEFNVFAPDEIRNVLRKYYKALKPDGTVVIEAHTFEGVQSIGQSPNSWYKSERGLFSDDPHLCLIENTWFEDEQTALQRFIVIDSGNTGIKAYRSTTRAWTDTEYNDLLTEAGFENISYNPDWPIQGKDLFLITARKK